MPARRPEPRQRWRPGRLLRPDGDDARRRRAAGGADRRRADPDGLPVHRARLAAGLLPGDPRRRPGPAQGPGGRTAMQSVADAFADGDRRSSPRTGTCSAGSGPTCRPTRRPARPPAPGALMRIGLVCPYQWDVPGGVQYHVRDLARTLRGLGHHVEVLTPGRARGVAHRRVDDLRRADRPGALQRLDGQHAVRPGLGRAGAAMAARRALRRRPRARADCAVGRRCWSA